MKTKEEWYKVFRAPLLFLLIFGSITGVCSIVGHSFDLFIQVFPVLVGLGSIILTTNWIVYQMEGRFLG